MDSPKPEPNDAETGTLTIEDPSSLKPTRTPSKKETFTKDLREAGANPLKVLAVIGGVIAIGCGTVFCTACLCGFELIPAGMIILGALNWNNCPAEKHIPIWLVVSGATSILEGIFRHFNKRKSNTANAPGEAKQTINPISSVLWTVNCIFLILGAYWIYSAYSRVQYTQMDTADYCDPFTYKFSFVFVTVTLAILPALCLIMCLILCCVACIAGCIAVFSK